ncbi:MAG: hypothetical protein IMZ49_00425 [Actinobacteria bacterium]|nr:hypothetical protein [Actinomycetota bacterium]MBE3126982.1 hypothetical protein [Candidatus Atribacteria bacterium]
MPQNPLYQRLTKTAADDLPFKIVTGSKWFEFLDIFVYTNNAYVGDLNGQDVLVAANAVYTITAPVDALDLVFKNAAAGSNTVVVIAGTELSERRAQVLGLVI